MLAIEKDGYKHFLFLMVVGIKTGKRRKERKGMGFGRSLSSFSLYLWGSYDCRMKKKPCMS